MANANNNGKLTIANIIAMAGLVLLFAFTFLGHSFKSGGEIGWDILVAVAVTALAAFMLWFLVKAKGAENQLEKWRKIEIGAFVAYVLAVIPLSFAGGVTNFFAANAEKARYKELARRDIAKIDTMFSHYEDFENNAIVRTGTGLRNSVGIGQRRSQELVSYMQQNNIAPNLMSVENYEDFQRMQILGTTYKKFHEQYRAERDEIENAVDSWNVLQIPSQAKRIEKLAESTAVWLTKRSESARLPLVEYYSTAEMYSITTPNQTEQYQVDGGIGGLEFRSGLMSAGGIGFGSILFLVVVHLLILLNYFVAYRTHSLGLSKHTDNDGGITL